MYRRLAYGATAAFTLLVGACSGGGDAKGANSSPAAGQPAATVAQPAVSAKAGTVTINALPLSASATDRFLAVAVGPDDKTYAAGFVTDESGDQAFALARLDAKGGLDKAFGKDGVASVNVAAKGKAAEVARSVVIQSTGKIVIAGPIEHDTAATGDAAKDTDVAVVRFDTAGKLDPTFGKDGVAIIDLGTGKATSATAFVGDTSWGMGNLPGDKLIVFAAKLADGLSRTDADYVAIGLTNTGALDPSFGAGGKVVIDLNGSVDNPRDVLVQPDGKIVVCGYTAIDGVIRPILARMNATGSLDTTFGKGGIVNTVMLPGATECYGMARQGADYIVAGYGRGADPNEKVDMLIERIKADGTWDSSFGSAGIARIDIAKEDDRARSVVALPDGRILVAGSGKRTASNADALLVMLSKDGAPDPAFGEKGLLFSDLGGPADTWFGIALSADKKQAIVVGYKGTDAASGGNDDAVVARVTF